MATFAKAYPGRNKLMTAAETVEYKVKATRRGDYINITCRPVNPQPDSREFYEIGSYYIPYKSLRLNAPDAEAFRPSAERMIEKVLSGQGTPLPSKPTTSRRQAADDCGCPGICRYCGSRCYGDCHQR